ncbi:MAG: Histone acetyltransferase HPA2-like protein [Bacteroidetes bacterium]|jgi:ribosomal protein S18 acetylase RimI-like enzyme|nr:Histone acetyltransferase HPA2-like protein [Bacteroidota bacterium]MDF2451937.1 Histone acetyltransferase HPA2-like protein [Bacteroidota bacterium]
MIEVQVTNDNQKIEEIIDLRYAVLRKPWDKPRDTATDDQEPTAVNAYIEENEVVIACGRLQDNGDGVGQIRYMAVHPDFQGKGLGKLILSKLEEEGRRNGMKMIELQARENAVEFYKSQNYTIKEASFKLWDLIQHYLMVKELK